MVERNKDGSISSPAILYVHTSPANQPLQKKAKREKKKLL